MAIPSKQPLAQDITYRSAVAADAAPLAELYLTARKTFLPYAPLAHTDHAIRLWISETLVPSGGVTVAETPKTIIGMMATSYDGSYGWIDHLYFDPGYVSLGLGGVLIEKAKHELVGPIRAYAFQQNAGARRFYQRHGFKEIALTDGQSNEEKVPDVLLQWAR